MESRAWGVIGSLIFHIGLIILLLATGFSTPLPLPAEEGVMINFGDGPDGSGLNEPSISQAASRPQPRPTQADPTPLTQDYEEAPSLPVPPRTTTKPTTKPTPKPSPQTTTTPEQPTTTQPEPTPEPPKQTVNQRAMFPGQKTDGSASSGEGDTGKAGNQGSPDGSPDSGSRTGGGNGAGGTGGVGISHTLEGFDITNLPEPKTPAVNGVVVVRVKVDASGKVVSAIGGYRGTTITESSVIKACEEAAKKSAFKRKASSNDNEATGEIVYRIRAN